MQEEQQVILVNERDEILGSAPKLEAHRNGVLHRAFSVFIFNSKGEMLLQQRSLVKYHSAGLWTNACCSHPMPGESTADAVMRRLEEEIGITTPVTKIFDFLYRAEFDNGLVEHEFDHVFAGYHDGPVVFNQDEVMDCKFLSFETIQAELEASPAQFTAWFRLIFAKVAAWHRQNFKPTLV